MVERGVTAGRFLAVLAPVLVGILALGGVTIRTIAAPWTIAGLSMAPTLLPGDRVVVAVGLLRPTPPKPGQVVLLRAPDGRRVVKRLAAAPVLPFAEGIQFDALGDNPAASRDSREFGPVSRDKIDGRVVWRYWPLSRLGPIR